MNRTIKVAAIFGAILIVLAISATAVSIKPFAIVKTDKNIYAPGETVIFKLTNYGPGSVWISNVCGWPEIYEKSGNKWLKVQTKDPDMVCIAIVQEVRVRETYTTTWDGNEYINDECIVCAGPGQYKGWIEEYKSNTFRIKGIGCGCALNDM